MPKNSQRLPRYRHHKGTGQAIVEWKGKRRYLGLHGSEKSLLEYARIIAEIKASGQITEPEQPTQATADLTINETVLRYLQFADGYYRKDGKPTGQIDVIKHALRPLRELAGTMLAKEFGPLLLKEYRNVLIRRNGSRKYINDCTGVVRKMFKWGVSEQLIPVQVHQALMTVTMLHKGRSAARETPPVKPVPQERIDGLQKHVSPTIWTMIQLQLLTGMRPAEVKSMRTGDINMSGRIWEYRPRSHKTEHFGHDKVILLGPRAQAALKPWLRTELEAYIFEAGPGQPYSRDSYRRAIYRGCDRAFPPEGDLARKEKESVTKWWDRLTPGQQHRVKAWRRLHRWHPHQLKHNAGTFIRREFGIEAAKVILGHRDIKTSEIYAERDLEAARSIVARIG